MLYTWEQLIRGKSEAVSGMFLVQAPLLADAIAFMKNHGCRSRVGYAVSSKHCHR